MRHVFTAILVCCICTSALSQSSFKEIDAEVRSWYTQNVESTSTISPKAPKTIDYSAQHYSVTGVISKGVLCDGTIAKFYDTSSLIPKLLLEGRVSYDTDRLVIKGVKYGNSTAETNKTYGTFYVYNMDDFSMNYKAKKAGDLKIKCSKASYLEGLYLRCPMIVNLVNGSSSVYVDGKTGGRGYVFLSAIIPNITLNNDDSFDLHQILLQAKDNVTMCWENGVMFKGSVKPTIREDSAIVFRKLEGQQIGMTTGPKKIAVSRENGNIVYSQDFNEDNKLLSNETLLVKDNGTLPENDYWNSAKIYELCYLAKWTYRNGNYFEGTIKTVVTTNENTNTLNISKTATKGVFKYPNGDRFEGNLTKSSGPFFIDGTTFFADGSKAEGDWLEKYKLYKDQWEKVNSCQNPTEARDLAKKLQRSHYYQEYYYPKEFEYFDPEDEKLSYYVTLSENIANITFDKAKQQYTFDNSYEDKHSYRGRIIFAVDKTGYRKWEIVYQNNKPKYRNEYTWYVNGKIESIKSFDYNTKKILLSCHFFSDGKLRSAYKYGIGNSGKNVLRKSKESHPTFGGYSCKQYDLDGQYERSINWDIGQANIWGVDTRLAPAKLELNLLYPIN